MPRYKVLKNVDSYSHYTAVIEAVSKEEAVEIAKADEREPNEDIAWEHSGYSEYDDVVIDVGDVEELDEHGLPVGESA
jgi:hypothetical protein